MTGLKRQGKFSIIAAVIFFGAVILAECQVAPPKISIESPHAILSPAIYGEAMVTMTIKNEGGADLLKRAETDIPGAKVSLHLMEGQRMVRVESLNIPGGGSADFKMGGSHIMIEDMPKTMGEGSSFNLTLVFEKSGVRNLQLTLEKAPQMPMGQPMN